MTQILPAHDQLYPSKLLPTRLEEYVLDGNPPTRNRACAVRVTGQQVFDAITKAQADLGMEEISPRYFVGTCFHESGCTNEWDTEIATASSPAGFVSVGAFQIGQEEAARYGFTLADMLDLDKASRCMVQLAGDNRKALRGYAKLPEGTPDPSYEDTRGELAASSPTASAPGTIWVAGTMRAFLAIAHNHGLGFAHQWIAANGMDWAKYKSLRPTDNIVAHGYGVDCITGGAYWPAPRIKPELKPGDRTLTLATPLMSGEDVRELQRHLRAIDPELDTDGVYGPKTAADVKTFQALHVLSVTGVVDAATWRALLS